MTLTQLSFRHRLARAAQHIAVLVGLSLLFCACATEKRDQWLRFFFDGVPDRTVATPEDMGSTPAAESEQPAHTEPSTTSKNWRKDIIHEPYAERSCDACHESKFSQRLGGTMLDVCFTCHDDFLADKQSRHSPAEEGDCIECHNPHKSPNQHLLKRTGGALCYECHDDLTTNMSSTHAPTVEGECMECHDPHASKNKHLLKQAVGALCYECHDDLTRNAKVKHAPAEEGDCMECHDPHASKNQHLLTRTGGALCYECHDEDDVLEAKIHQTMGKTNCTTCHNPHAGDQSLLIPGWETRTNGAGE